MTVNHHTAMDVNPRKLVFQQQVRADAEADEALVESIRRRGVLQPIVVTEPEPDTFVILAGHRRTLAALKAGLQVVPISVVQVRAAADTILDQLAENDHRASITEADRLTGYGELALIGLTADEISQAAAVPVSEVEAGLKVAGSEVVRELAPSLPQLDLEQLAAMAEFEDDEDAIDELHQAAMDRDFAHVLRRLQRDRFEAQAVAARVAELEAAGVTVVERPTNEYDGNHVAATLSWLNLTKEAHASCPGRAAAAYPAWVWSDGYGSEQVLEVRELEVCTDWKANGHEHDAHRRKTATGGTPAAELPDAEREAKAAERRETIARNKAWPIATEVRRAWLKDFFTGTATKRSTAETQLWVARALVSGSLSFAGHHAAPGFFTQWTGEETGWRAKKGLAKGTTQARLDQLLHAMSLAAVESYLDDKSAWRDIASAKPYLLHLEQLGYGLSEIEKFVAHPPRKGKANA